MKKIITSLLIITFALSYCCVFAEENTEEKQADYMVAAVYELGILLPDADGNQLLAQEASRIDFAIALYRMMNYQNRYITPEMGECGYSDVGKFHFASGYLKYLSAMGIVNGYSDGSFRPDQTITVAEAYATAVRAAGYFRNIEVESAQILKTAQTIGLTKNVSEGQAQQATNEVIAHIFYNLMFSDCLLNMEAEGGKWKLTNSDDFQGQYMNLTSEEGVIYQLGGVSLYDEIVPENHLAINQKTFLNALKLPEDYLGSNAIVFYDVDTQETAAVVRREQDNHIVTLKSEDILKYQDGVYEYTSEENGKSKRMKLAENADVLYNNYVCFEQSLMYPEYGKLIFIDNNDDGKYEVLQIFGYESYMFESYSEIEAAQTIQMKNEDASGKRIILDLNSYERVRIYAADGSPMKINKIKKNAIVTVCRAKDKMLFLYCCEAVMEETVLSFQKEEDMEKIKLDDGSEQILIPSVYKTAAKELKPGVYTLYFDINGRVAAAILSSARGWEYGYLLKCYYDEVEDEIGIRMLNQENKVVEYLLRDKILVDDEKYTCISAAYDEISASYLGFKQANLYEQMSTRLIRYYLNNNNEVTKIDTPYRQGLFETSEPVKYNENNKLLLRVKGRLYSKADAGLNFVTIYNSDIEPGLGGDIHAIDSEKMLVFVIPDHANDVDYQNHYKATTLQNSGINAERWCYSSGYNLDPESVYSDVMVIRKPVSGEWSDDQVVMIDRIGEGVNDADEVVDELKVYNGKKEPAMYTLEEESTVQGYELKKGDIVLASIYSDRIKVNEILYRDGGQGTLNNSSYKWDTQPNAQKRIVRTEVERRYEDYWIVNCDSSEVPDASIVPLSLITIFDVDKQKIYLGNDYDIYTKEIYADQADTIIYKTSNCKTTSIFAVRCNRK